MSRIKHFLSNKLYSWYLYDWANSAYSTTVITLFLGPYLTSLSKSSEVEGLISYFGFQIPAGSVFPYTISISVILQALILPIIGAFTDYYRKKNIILGFFTFVGSVSTMAFLFESNYLFASFLLIISNFSFGSAIVIYNSFLNQISNEDERKKVSSVGWAVGYIGGGLLLVINLLIFQNYDSLGIDKGLSVRLNIALAGLWWAIFALPAILNLKFNNQYIPQNKASFILKSTFGQLNNTFKLILNNRVALLFLIAFLLYNDGVQSVISLSSLFGQEELKLSIEFLTIVILVVQFFAAFGALVFNYFADKIGEKNTLLYLIVIWIIILLYAFLLLSNAYDFFTLAIFIALVMGGIQAISRSVYSKLIPNGKEAEFFSFYEISEKGTSWMGPFLFGIIYQFTGSYRYAILSLTVFFVLGGLILFFTNIEKKIINNVKETI